MNLSHKSRFWLTLELYVCGFAGIIGMAFILIGKSFMPLGLLFFAPATLYLHVSRELKTRREPLTQKQKCILFAIQASFCGIIIFGLLAVALLKEIPLAWIVFALISVVMLASLFYGYKQTYKYERALIPSLSRTAVLQQCVQSS